MSNPEQTQPSLDELKKKLEEETGITQPERDQAEEAQTAAEETIQNATAFFTEQALPFTSTREQERETHGITLVPPYSEEELSKIEKLLAQAGIEFRSDFYQEHKPHLLSALTFASYAGIDLNEVIKALSDYIREEKERLPYLADSGISYEPGSYFVEEYIVEKLAQKKGLEVPESLKPSDERRKFLEELTSRLTDTERELLARYIASTPTGFSTSPFYHPVLSLDVSNQKNIKRQNIAVAISPQSFELELIRRFLSQRGIREENFLLALANPHLQEIMPFGRLLAGDYRVTLQYSPTDRRKVSMREAIEQQIEKSYTEKPIGSEPKGLLPLEELAGRLVVNNLQKLEQEGVKSRLAPIIPQVLQAEDPLAEIKKVFPDFELWFGENDLSWFSRGINGLKEAIEHPDKVPPKDFWYQLFAKPDKASSYLYQIRDTLLSQFYQVGGEDHLQRWGEVVKAFVVSEGQERNGPPLTLRLISADRIGVFKGQKPLFELAKREDGQWYPTSYWDKKNQKQIFDIEGMTYDELQKMIATSPFRYQDDADFLREILREDLNKLAQEVYDQIRT